MSGNCNEDGEQTSSTPQLWQQQQGGSSGAGGAASVTDLHGLKLKKQQPNDNNNRTSNSTNRRSDMPSSPSGMFGPSSFGPSLASSAAAVNKINKSMPLSSTSGIKPEKLFSASHLNKKMANSTRNLANGNHDSDGGGSDLSSASVKSAQSEFQKGANVISSLTMSSDPNRITTVSTNANNTITTTTLVKGKRKIILEFIKQTFSSNVLGRFMDSIDTDLAFFLPRF
jgi:hypothetical protein